MREDTQGSGQDGPFSIGDYLKAQREIRGIDLEELSVRTRIPLRSLARLEQGAFDGHPDGFVRGFVRTVAEGLGVDPEDTLMRMLAEPSAARAPRSRMGLPLRAWLALVVGGAAALAGIVLLHAALWTGSESNGPDMVIRRDPVRALAEANAASAGRSSGRDEERASGTAGVPSLRGRSAPAPRKSP